MKPGSCKLIAIGIIIEIASQLVAEKIVVGEVLVESPDDPVSISNIVPVKVLVHPVGVGKADKVKPVSGHVFTVLLPGKEKVYQFLIGVGALITKE